MERIVKLGLLCDFYGKLLTERQLLACRLQGDEDKSLSEIASELGISRQAVHDLIRRSQETMESFEEALGLIETRFKRQQALMRIAGELEEIAEKLEPDSASKLRDLAEELNNWR
jgi:predicted DNA-binding protein YlxM (UPF0122 family)